MTTHPVPRKDFIHRLGRGPGKRVAAAGRARFEARHARARRQRRRDQSWLMWIPRRSHRRFLAAPSRTRDKFCSAIKRVYVPEQMYNALLDNLGEIAKGVKVGDGLEAGTQLGPNQ